MRVAVGLNKHLEELAVGDKVRTDFAGRADVVHTIEVIDRDPSVSCQSGVRVILSGLREVGYLDAAWAVPVEEDE